jgi:hypothetical protein
MSSLNKEEWKFWGRQHRCLARRGTTRHGDTPFSKRGETRATITQYLTTTSQCSNYTTYEYKLIILVINKIHMLHGAGIFINMYPKNHPNVGN